MSIITKQQLEQLAPDGKPNIIAAIANQSDRVFVKYKLTTLPRVVIFIGLILEETGHCAADTENLNYTAARLTKVWPTRFPTAASAKPFEHNPEALANKVYGNRRDLGNTKPGDGWLYRGRGLIQITGRANYASKGRKLGIDLAANPELAISDEWMLEISAAQFVSYKGILASCDGWDAGTVWHQVGGGYINIANHRTSLDRTKAVITALGAADT